MEQRITCTRILLEREITANVVVLDKGLEAIVYGGHSSHVGAVSAVDGEGKLQTIIFPGHKDQYVSDIWAEKLSQRFRCPVVVTAGIHYDNISPQEIQQVLDLSEEMLELMCSEIEKIYRL